MGLCMQCGGVLVFQLLGCLLVGRKGIVSFVLLARDMELLFHDVCGEWHVVVVCCGIVFVSNCLHGM